MFHSGRSIGLLSNMKAYTIGKIFVILTIPLVFLTCNTFADDDVIEELHKESAILVSQERYNDALNVFDHILEIDPNNVKALINRSAVLITIGQNYGAIDDVNRILTIDPNNVKALSNKGISLANIGYTYDAIANFEKAIDIDPNNKELRDGRNRLLQLIDLFVVSPQTEKYDVHVHVQVRTSENELISVVEGVQMEYLPFNLTDEFLNKYPVIRIVEKNGKDYEVRQIIHKTHEQQISENDLPKAIKPKMKSYGHMQLNTLCNEIPGCINVFAGRIASIVLDGGDYMITQWTIHRLVE